MEVPSCQLAERRAIKCNTYLRRDDGSWDALYVQTPTARQCRLFVGFDKSHKKLASGGIGRKLKEAIDYHLTGSLSQHTSHLLKWDGVVTIDWMQLAKIEPVSYSEYRLLWSNEIVAKLDLPKQDIIRKFEELVAASAKGKEKGGKTGNTEWSV